MQFLVSFLGRESWLLCGCLCSVSTPHDAVGVILTFPGQTHFLLKPTKHMIFELTNTTVW